MPQVEAGNARLIAVGTASRLPSLPETANIAESGYPGLNASAWLGVVYPRATPPEIVARMALAIRKAVDEPAMRASLAAMGAIARTSTADEFADHLKSEYQRWEEIVRQSGVKRQ